MPIYTITYKLMNVELESDTIQLADSAWLEKSDDFSTSLEKIQIGSLLAFDNDPIWGFTRFYSELLSSKIRLKTIYTEQEKNPFGRHECSYIAFTLAILCDGWFCAGYEEFGNNINGVTSSTPHANFFSGNNEGSLIKKYDEQSFIQAYNHIFKIFSSYHRGFPDELHLLFLGIKCIAKIPYQRFDVLNMGFDHLFTEWHSCVLNAALFYEALFSVESTKSNTIKKNIKKWNEMFPDFQIDLKLTEIVMDYRHLFAHFNATGAKQRIDDWHSNANLRPEKSRIILQKHIFKTAKIILRVSIFKEDRFRKFRLDVTD